VGLKTFVVLFVAGITTGTAQQTTNAVNRASAVWAIAAAGIASGSGMQRFRAFRIALIVALSAGKNGNWSGSCFACVTDIDAYTAAGPNDQRIPVRSTNDVTEVF
jgi:hypothetical protein